MKKVYRIENIKNGFGPYRQPDGDLDSLNVQLLEIMRYEHSIHADGRIENNPHPGGFVDFGNLLKGDIFGFDSLEKLYTWFDKWLEYLFEMGFVINEYQTDYIIEGITKKTSFI